MPFGEYLPFQDLLERLGLRQLTKQVGGFLPGDRRRAMDVPGAPKMLPLICYEIIFPGNAVPRGERPGWLINLTNDGWFGISTGPYQHFQQARVRAIEEGLPLVRAANTGISAVIDPLGRVINSAAARHRGRARCETCRTQSSRRIFARFGRLHLDSIACVVSFIVVSRRRIRS